MKRPSLLAVSLILFFLPYFLTAQEKITIAVLSLEAKNVDQEIAEAVADILSTELFNSNRFNVIERQSITRILEEQQLQMTGVTDMTTAIEIGKVLNVEKIMIGSVSRLGNTYIVNTRLVDVKTGELQLAQNAKSERGEQGLTNAINELVQKISEQITVEGSIIKIDRDMLLIDLGSNHGIFEGQNLTVHRIGDVVTDLGGTIIGRSEDLIGVILIKSAKPDYSEAEIQKRQTSFRLGDKVRVPVKAVKIEEKPRQQVRLKKIEDKDKKTPVEPPPVF